jgi:hypothetical protein
MSNCARRNQDNFAVSRRLRVHGREGAETKLRRRVGRRRKSASARRNQDNFAVSGRRKSVSRRLRVHGREGEETKLRRRVGRRRKSASARRNRKSVCRRLGERRPRARRNQTLSYSYESTTSQILELRPTFTTVRRVKFWSRVQLLLQKYDASNIEWRPTLTKVGRIK